MSLMLMITDIHYLCLAILSSKLSAVDGIVRRIQAKHGFQTYTKSVHRCLKQ